MIDFDIFEAKSKKKVGVIKNVYSGIFADCFTKADRYHITFPHDAEYKDKVLLNFAALMIDYNLFEDILL